MGQCFILLANTAVPSTRTLPALHRVQGIVNRLAFDEAEVEERVFVEAITNQYESREAVKYAGGCGAVQQQRYS